MNHDLWRVFGAQKRPMFPIGSLDVTPRDVHSQLMSTHVKEPVKGVRTGSSWQGKYSMKCSECEKLKKNTSRLPQHESSCNVFHFNTLTLSTQSTFHMFEVNNLQNHEIITLCTRCSHLKPRKLLEYPCGVRDIQLCFKVVVAVTDLQ